MTDTDTSTDASTKTAEQAKAVSDMVAAIQAGAEELGIIEAITAKMKQGGLDPARGDLCIAPKAWAAHVKNPPAWLTFSPFLTDKPIFSPASSLLDLAR